MKLDNVTLTKIFPGLLVIGGIIGLVASLILTHDTLAISQNSHYIPSCNLNPVLSCGNVINSPGDKIFGLPYPFYGLVVFPVLITIGVSMVAGAKFKKWYWITFQALITLGTIGAYYLLLKSIYKIHSLCPFCLLIDVVTTILFWYTTLYILDNKIFTVSNTKLNIVCKWIRKHYLDLLILWFMIVIGLILKHFWYYYGQHL